MDILYEAANDILCHPYPYLVVMEEKEDKSNFSGSSEKENPVYIEVIMMCMSGLWVYLSHFRNQLLKSYLVPQSTLKLREEVDLITVVVVVKRRTCTHR